MATVNKQITLEDLQKLPGDLRYEVVEGELIEMAPAGHVHGEIGGNFTIVVGAYIRQHKLGRVLMAETGFILSQNPLTLRAPDFAFIPNERIPEERPASFSHIVPALVAEVVSPGDTASEIENKVQEWLAFGVSQVWVVYPESQRIHIFEPENRYAVYHGEDVIRGGEVLPGFEIKAHEIFD